MFLKNISFHGILLDALFEEGNADWEVVGDLLTQGIKDGAVRPLNTTVFDKEEVEAAFRFMAQGKHIGKVLVKVSFSLVQFCNNFVKCFLQFSQSPLQDLISFCTIFISSADFRQQELIRCRLFPLSGGVFSVSCKG